MNVPRDGATARGSGVAPALAEKGDPSLLDNRVGNAWLATCRLIGYGLLTVLLLLPQIAALICWPRFARCIPRTHHWLAARVVGLCVRGEGEIATGKSIFFVSNHVSYFDIIALGSILQGNFVAKSDVATWPIFGPLARLCGTLFIERRSTGAIKQVDIIRSRLERGDSLIVFPEGTSSDGSRVLPFKSTLFAAVEGKAIIVQPISIHYSRLNGMPIGRAYRPFYAWYGDMDLAPHLWSALSLGVAEVVIRFHAPVRASTFSDRKTLAKYCHAQISRGLGPDTPHEAPLDLALPDDSLDHDKLRGNRRECLRLQLIARGAAPNDGFD